MGLKLTWVGEGELDRVAQTRCYCYAPAAKDLDGYKERIRLDGRAKPGDYLLAERDGVDVGTSTSLSFQMWARGLRVPCQGVAFVGTIKTHRRVGRGAEKGIASQLMDETIRRARERGEVVSALMPFRASYYEHFGYGLAERRFEWTVPIAILPPGSFEGIRLMKPEDLPLVQACRQRMVESGQCDLERAAPGWSFFGGQWGNGYCVVDQPSTAGPVHSWMYFVEVIEAGKAQLRIVDMVWDSQPALRRQLHFLGSLRDQYSAAVLQLPSDLPLNWLLKETQLPHRPVEHPVARVQPLNRMQVRVLDHVKFLHGQKLRDGVKGAVRVEIRETEGQTSSVQIDISDGHVSAKTAAGPADISCADKVWASIACGDITASTFARMGLVDAPNAAALRLLDEFASGPAPFCTERF